jgi:hypothetical protein
VRAARFQQHNRIAYCPCEDRRSPAASVQARNFLAVSARMMEFDARKRSKKLDSVAKATVSHGTH